MVKIRISYENELEREAIIKALEPIVNMKVVKGAAAGEPFRKLYITGTIDTVKSCNESSMMV